MDGFRASFRACGKLCVLVVVGCIHAAVGFAGVQDSRFVISPDGAFVDFDVRDVPRREVMTRLFADKGIKLEWLTPSFGDEKISGTFKGSHAAVAQQLLAQSNFVVVRDPGGENKISRLIIIGPAATGTAGVPADMAVPVIAPAAKDGTIPVIEPVAKDGVIPVIEPVAKDGVVPVIEPLAMGGVIPNIVPVPTGTAAPQMVPAQAPSTR
jgi:hypothetical protein